MPRIGARRHRPAYRPARIAHELTHPHYRVQRSGRHVVEVDDDRFRAELLAELA